MDEPFDALRTRGIEKGLRTEHIRRRKHCRSLDAPVHMRLGGEMHDGVNTVGFHGRSKGRPIANVPPDERVFLSVLQTCEVLQISRVGQLVEIHQPDAGMGIKKIPDKVASNESSTPCYQE
jgi:hypothetical protein